MEHIIFMERKIKQYERDLSLMIKSTESLDRIKTAYIKQEFEDLVANNIIELGKKINELKKFIREEKEEGAKK